MVQFLFLRRVDCSSLFFMALNTMIKVYAGVNYWFYSLPYCDCVGILFAFWQRLKKQISKQYLLIFHSSKSKHFPDCIKTFQSKHFPYIPKYSSSNILRSDSISSSIDFLFSSGTNSAYCFAFSRISA